MHSGFVSSWLSQSMGDFAFDDTVRSFRDWIPWKIYHSTQTLCAITLSCGFFLNIIKNRYRSWKSCFTARKYLNIELSMYISRTEWSRKTKPHKLNKNDVSLDEKCKTGIKFQSLCGRFFLRLLCTWTQRDWFSFTHFRNDKNDIAVGKCHESVQKHTRILTNTTEVYKNFWNCAKNTVIFRWSVLHFTWDRATHSPLLNDSPIMKTVNLYCR